MNPLYWLFNFTVSILVHNSTNIRFSSWFHHNTLKCITLNTQINFVIFFFSDILLIGIKANTIRKYTFFKQVQQFKTGSVLLQLSEQFS